MTTKAALAVLPLLLTTVSAFAVLPVNLERQIRDTPLIVVGHVAKIRGYIGEGVWEVELSTSAILKGIPTTPLSVFWTRAGLRHVRQEDQPPSTSEINTERIWFLSNHVERNMMTAYEFQHPLRSISERDKIEKLIRKLDATAGKVPHQ